jgi:hypothetical protein
MERTPVDLGARPGSCSQDDGFLNMVLRRRRGSDAAMQNAREQAY